MFIIDDSPRYFTISHIPLLKELPCLLYWCGMPLVIKKAMKSRNASFRFNTSFVFKLNNPFLTEIGAES
jgi:hypothetical protein